MVLLSSLPTKICEIKKIRYFKDLKRSASSSDRMAVVPVVNWKVANLSLLKTIFQGFTLNRFTSNAHKKNRSTHVKFGYKLHKFSDTEWKKNVG